MHSPLMLPNHGPNHIYIFQMKQFVTKMTVLLVAAGVFVPAETTNKDVEVKTNFPINPDLDQTIKIQNTRHGVWSE